jgi:hypothetical protein
VRLSIGGTVHHSTNPMGKVFVNILPTFAQFEVDLLRMRTREGLAILREGAGHVWAIGGNRGWLARIDEATERVTVTDSLRPYLCCVAAGGGSVWVAEVTTSPGSRPTVGCCDAIRSAAQRSETRLRRWASLGHRRHDRTAAADRRANRSAAQSPSRQPPHWRIGITRDRRGERDRPADHANARPRTPGAPRRLGEDWLNPTDPAVTRRPSGTGRWQWQLDHAICAELYAYPAHVGEAWVKTTAPPRVRSGTFSERPEADLLAPKLVTSRR